MTKNFQSLNLLLWLPLSWLPSMLSSHSEDGTSTSVSAGVIFWTTNSSWLNSSDLDKNKHSNIKHFFKMSESFSIRVLNSKLDINGNITLPLSPLLLDCRFFELVHGGLCGFLLSSHWTICCWRTRRVRDAYDKYHKNLTLIQANLSIWTILHFPTCWELFSGIVGSTSSWLVIRVSGCHLLAVSLSVCLAGCGVLRKKFRAH